MEDKLTYYMSLPYKIEILPIPESVGGGYSARLPEIGKFAITGDGDTPQEAIDNLEEIKRERFKEYLTDGVDIPEPLTDFEQYSGKFIVRIPKILHKQLSESAKLNQVSLNRYVTYLLSTNFQLEKSHSYFSKITGAIACVSEAIWNISYQFPERQEREFGAGFGKKLKENETIIEALAA